LGISEDFALDTFLTDPFPLERYGYNLTHLARQGVFAPSVKYEKYVASIFQILLRENKGKHSPLLLDSDERRRLQIVTETVRQMAKGEAPDSLSTKQVIALNYEALFTFLPASLEDPFSVAQQSEETAQEGDLARFSPEKGADRLFSRPTLQQRNVSQIVFSRLQALFLAVRQTEGRVVLFVDHFHRLLGGEEQRYPIDAANLLIPALARHAIQIIGACTLAQYRQHIERFAAIEFRLQAICIESDDES
jgi:ATP-dependent Clp protease ATP-binding subunit ClpA